MISKQKSDEDALNRMTDPDFLHSLKGFGAAIKETFGDALKAVSKVREELGTDVFDITEIDEYVDKMTELNDAMSSYAKTVKNLNLKQFNVLAKTIQQSQLSLFNSKEEILDIQKTFEGIKSPLFEQLDKMDDKLRSIPMFGKLLGDAFDIEALKGDKNGGLGKTLKDNIIENMKDGAVSMSSLMKAAFDTIKSMAAGLGRVLKVVMLNPWVLGILAVALLIKKFVELENEAQNFREATGQSFKSAKQLTHEIEESALSARMFGVEMEDVYGSAQSLISVIGSSKLITGEMATDLAVLSKMTGITSDNAAGVYKQFAATGGATSKSATNMANTLAYTSQLMGVPMDVMFSDVAESGEFIAQYMGQSANEISKAAIQARLLGLTMKDVESITSSIMDFEGSIEKELMASILVGKQINFNRARYLSMQGDISGATKEVMRQVGSLEEFNALNPIAAKSLADAAGLTVEKLRDSLYTQKLIKTAGGEYGKELQRAQDIIDGTTAMSEAERMAQDRANLSNRGAMKEMGDAWGQIGASLTKVVLPAIQGISWLLKGIADFVLMIFGAIDSVTGGTDSWLGKLIKAFMVIGTIIGSLLVVKVIMQAINSSVGKMFGGGAVGGAGGAGGGGGLMGKIFGGLSPTTMLAGAASILIISGALWVFAKALQEMKDVKVETLIMAVVGLAALAGVALLVGSAAPMMLLGAAAILVISGAFYVFALAANAFIPVIQAVSSSIVSLGQIDAVNLIGVAAGIGAIGLALAAFGAGSVYAGVGSFIGNFLGGDPIEKLKTLATLGPGLLAAAAGIQATNMAMSGETIPINATPEAVNLPVNASATLNETIANGDNLIIEKLNQLIETVNKQDIYLDNRKVNTNLGRNINTSKLN